MSSHMSNRENEPVSAGYVPSAWSASDGRRNFRPSDKRRIVAEALAPGSSLSVVARRYGIDKPLLFRWKRELAPPEPGPVFLPVTVSDDGPCERVAASAMLSSSLAAAPATGPVIVEQPRDGIEVELVGGRRVRFARDIDPGTVRTIV